MSERVETAPQDAAPHDPAPHDTVQDTDHRDTAHLEVPPGAPGHPHSDVPPPLDPSSTETQPLDVVVVTGLSGAGKNSAGRVLEDLG